MTTDRRFATALACSVTLLLAAGCQAQAPATTVTAPAAAPSTTATSQAPAQATTVTAPAQATTTVTQQVTQQPSNAATSARATTTTPAGPPRVSTAGWGDLRFGTVWQEAENMRWYEAPGNGPACSVWSVTAKGKEIGRFYSHQKKGNPVIAYQSGYQTPGIKTVSGLEPGVSTRDDVTRLGLKKVVSNGAQEAYATEGDGNRLTVDVDPTTGVVGLITIVPADTPAQSFAATEFICT